MSARKWNVAPNKRWMPCWTIAVLVGLYQIVFAEFVESQLNEAKVRLNQGLVVGVRSLSDTHLDTNMF